MPPRRVVTPEDLEAAQITAKPWRPQPGPQEKAIRASFVTELFFGGARGGGKSDYLLGDYAVDINTYGAHWRGVLIRRTYPELDELIERSHAVFPAAFPGCQYRVGSKTWRFPSGAMLRLRHLKHEADADHYQGHAYCVAEGTLVWMADGSMVPIERVRVGDMVQTLEGPRTVTGTMVPQIKECVEVFHGTTSLQCHPIDHPLLGTSSWQSAASLLHTSATGTSQTSQGFDRPPCVSMSARCAVRTREHGEPCGTPPDSATFPPSREGLPQWSLETLQGALPQIAESLTRRPSQRAGHHETPGYTSLQSLWRAGGCAPIGPEGERGFQGDCLPDRHSGGEQPQLPTASAQGASPSQVCAVAPSLSRYTQDDSGSTQGHSRTCEPAYAHPYTGEPRFPLLRTRDVALTLSPCGPRLVYDLTVQEVNHYITGSQGLVNRNSWIGFDELTSWPSLRAYHKLKACLRVGSISIPVKRIRATGNPGGPGHIAVKSYFIDPAPESTIITDPETGDTRMFIRSRLTDNHILMHNDPNYASRLRGVGDAALVKAWLTGDWDVFVGQYFSSWDTNDVVIDSFDVPESWPLFGAMDYGEASPTSFGLYTVDHDFTVYRIQGYYMANKSGSQHADAINKMIDACPFTAGRRPSVIYVDPSMFTRRRLSSEQVVTSPADVFAAGNLFLTPANNDRITGWRNINDALVKGRFKAFRGWNDALVNTLPALPRDPANPEDVDSDAEDHAGDELRYAMMHVYKPALAVAAPDRNPILGANVLKSMEVHRKPEHRRRRSLVL